MNQDVKQETKIRQYLLGELPLEEQVLLEQRLFLESEYAEMAQAVEDDLVDEYLHDDLSGGERKKFEDHFLGQPEHRADLRIAQALEKYMTSEVVVEPRKGTVLTSIRQLPSLLVSLVTPRRAVSAALATSLLIVFSVITWNAFKPTRPGSGELLQAKDQQPANTPSVSQPSPSPAFVNGNKEQDVKPGPPEKDRGNQAVQQRPPTAIATFQILPGGLARSGGRPNAVRISPDTKTVVLILPLDFAEQYPNYHYELIGDGPVSQGDLKPAANSAEPAVSIALPAKLLNRDLYEITMRGIAADGRSSAPSSYYFKVERPRQ